MRHKECETTFANGVTGYLEHDQDCMSPLQDDSAVKFVVLHRRYVDPADGACGTTPDEVRAWARANRKEWQEFPLFMYDHSGTSYSITPFACPWDSGRVGSIFLKKSEFTRGRRAKSAGSIAEEYTRWANGDCWGYVLEDEDGEQLDSCWGFIGMDYAEQEMKDAAAYHVEQEGERMASETAADIQDSRPDLSPA